MNVQPNRRLSMAVAASGTIIEWFDFSLFFFLAQHLSATFYPSMEDSLLIVLATGAIGFIFRPLGAVVFGHIGDTWGRTVALVVSAGLMAISTAGIALTPGFATLGIWGGILVLMWRALAGFSVGAEYTGIMVYLMESARPDRRGLAASWAAANSELGALFAVGSAALTAWVLGEDDMAQWGWRIPFVVGALLAAGMIPLRRFMVESPAMSEISHGISGQRFIWWKEIVQQRRAVFVSFCISTVGSATYFLTITYLPTYIEALHGGSTLAALNAGTIAAFAAICVTPLVGFASDVLGRRSAFIVTLLGVVMLTLPGYAALASDRMWVIALAVAALAIPAAAWSAIAASAVPEQFDTRGRFTGMAFGYNLATVLFGGLTPFIVTLLMRYSGSVLAPAYYALGIALLSGVPAVLLMRRSAAAM